MTIFREGGNETPSREGGNETPSTMTVAYEVLVVKTETFRYEVWGESEEELKQTAIDLVKDGVYMGASGANYHVVLLDPSPDDE